MNSSSDQQPTTVTTSKHNAAADKWGEITIAQPKIWQFERVSSLLDGLLRDVEGVSLADLTQLDPSQQNGAAMKFIQSALEVGVQYDQAAAVNAANTLSSYKAVNSSQVQQLDQYNSYTQTLESERSRLAAQYAAASNEVNTLQALQSAETLSPGQQKQLDDALSRQASTQASLASVNSLITSAGAAPSLTAPPTVTGTSVQGPASGSSMASSLMGFSDVLKSLPQGVQNNLSTSLQSPSYPATKRLDNFITLLYERLSREISVLQDDLTRDPDNVAFLFQFDVGLYPSKNAKDHVARVEFDLDCVGCKVYSLYPGQSSYNLANFSGAGKRNTFWGNALTLLGFGASASYRRQTDTLQGSLVQSVYVSGFENGVMDDEDPKSQVPVNANQAQQSFGWYYGAAPFEQVVSPGIRSTFAIVTVPRDVIPRDRFGNANGCLPFQINGAWASRNDPMAQDGHFSVVAEGAKYAATPIYKSTRTTLFKDGTSAPASLYDASVVTKRTNVRLPVSLDDYSLVALREKHKLHVLRMEYNTVDEEPESVAAAGVQTTIQTTTQSTNLTTGQTTGQSVSQSTGTSVVAASGGKTASNAAVSNAASSLDPLPCPKGKCAAMLLRLDRPIDPNLVVTVHGEPLVRVRDWRGRATSVLPAAQSGTDLAAAASGSGSLLVNQLEKTRSLLESDLFAPNTWYALNSTELLLNISVNVASNEEFPVIQLADPSGSVVIPHDLRRNVTELIVNGQRMRPQTELSVQRETARENWSDTHLPPPVRPDAPIFSGPYAFSTFLPLFSPSPARRDFFAYVGDTGESLLIGFLPRSAEEKESDKTSHFDWLETRTQVVLEDRKLDFAWSLVCDVQGELLACDLPRKEISRVYSNYLKACPDDNECPTLDIKNQPLLFSQRRTARREKVAIDLARPQGAGTQASPSRQSPSQSGLTPKAPVQSVNASFALPPVVRVRSLSGTQNQSNADESTAGLSYLQTQKDLSHFEDAFLSTMQVWIEQSDPEHRDIFYSPEPARVNFLPLSDDYVKDQAFSAWQFTGADADNVTLQECNYWPSGKQSDVWVRLLGVRAWPGSIPPRASDSSAWVPLQDASSRCGWFRIPTAALVNDPVVFVMRFPFEATKPEAADNKSATRLAAPAVPAVSILPDSEHSFDTTIAIAKARLGPYFKKPVVRSTVPPIARPVTKGTTSPADKPGAETRVWSVVIPVSNSTCQDSVEFPPDLLPTSAYTGKDGHTVSEGPDHPRIGIQWLNGFEPLTACTEWQKADQAGRVNLKLEIPKAVMGELPERVDVVRTTSDKAKWVVGTLPNLRALLLPTHLSLVSIGATQFALRGDNAGVIDAVAMQSNDNSAVTFQTAPGVDFALVTLPSAAGSPSDSADKSVSGNSSTNTMQVTVDVAKDNSGRVTMATNNSTQPKALPANKKASDASSPSEKPTGPSALAAGSYAVIPLIVVGTTPADQSKVKAAEAELKSAEAEVAKAGVAGKAVPAKSASPAVPAKPAPAAPVKDPKQAAADRLAKARTALAQAQANAKPTPIYMPLAVSDEEGKPLIFKIADPKKQNAATPSPTTTSTQTCTAPCTLAPCVATCPPAPSQPVAPKSP